MQEYSGNFCKRIPTDIDLPAVGASSLKYTITFSDRLCVSVYFLSITKLIFSLALLSKKYNASQEGKHFFLLQVTWKKALWY